MLIKKVACYVRVSTENQIENYSIEEQIERLNAYCKAKDYSVYKTYTDGGYSGGNTNRPALQEMIRDVQDGKVDAVVVYKLDRLSRSQKDTLTLIEDNFLSHNIDFISVSENFDTSTPFGRAMIGILSVFAQLEKDQITERFTMGRIGRCKAGYFHGGGNAPKGYNYVDGELIVNEYESEQVREIFREFLSGKSVNVVSKLMESKYKNGAWNNSLKITNCIRNTIYIGKVKFKNIEYDGIHTPIVLLNDFQRANYLLNCDERADSKTPTQKTPFRASYLLSSLIYCKQCGARYSGNHGYYKCYSRSKSSKQFIKDPNCKNQHWKIELLDNIVIQQIRKMTLEENYKKLFESIPQITINTPALEREITQIDNQINKLIDLYQISNIPLEDIKQKIEALSEKKNHIQALMNTQNNTNRQDEFIASLKHFEEVLQNGDLDEKRLTIASIIEYIEIDGANVSLKWRI